MKKTFLFAFIFLAACSGQIPQVTVTSEVTVASLPPTETPTPTPTLHPQFIALQDQIAASGERFTLNPDGTVQDGATAIPELNVAPDGKITITVNGEQVEINPSIMNFDDENGLSIEGFEDTDGDGEWEVAQLTPEQQLAVDLERWNMTGDKYNVEYDEEGKIELREKGTNRLVYWDGKWGKDVVVGLVNATNNCQATNFESVGANEVGATQKEEFSKFRISVIKEAMILTRLDINDPSLVVRIRMEPINRNLNCWGMWFGDKKEGETHFAWPKADGEVEVVSVFEPQ